MKRVGLRATMLVPLLVALTVGSAALGLFVHRAVARDMMTTIDSEVARALGAAIGRFGAAEPRPPVPAGADGSEGDGDGDGDGDSSGGDSDRIDDVEVPLHYAIDADGTVLLRPAGDANVITDAQLAELLATGGVGTIDGQPRYRAGSRATATGVTVVTALSLRSVDESLASLRRNLLLGGAVLVLVQAAVVALVARRVTDPVVRLSGVAHRIAAGDFETDIGAPAGPRETAALTADLTAMLARLLEAIGERERAAADAEHARADMERFMADASHELRTPLTAIGGYSDLYLAGMLDVDGLDRAMTRIGSESARLTALVRDLLQLVQPSDPRRTAPTDLAALASAVVHDLRAAHPWRTVRLDLRGADGAVVHGDPERLHQAVLNLGANACQHTPAGVDIVVRVSTDHAGAVIEVADRGPGVADELALSIFQPFTRGETSRSRSDHDGAGLGLALAHHIVVQHHGTIDVSATPGGGATFTIRLPLEGMSH